MSKVRDIQGPPKRSGIRDVPSGTAVATGSPKRNERLTRSKGFGIVKRSVEGEYVTVKVTGLGKMPKDLKTSVEVFPLSKGNKTPAVGLKAKAKAANFPRQQDTSRSGFRLGTDDVKTLALVEESAGLESLSSFLKKAIEIFGSKEGAEQWLASPAIGLERRRPIDLLGTPDGFETVATYLGRIEYGVYA